MHPPLFHVEYAAFWALAPDQRVFVDPAWLAVFLMVLCLGANNLDESTRQSLGWSEEQVSEMVLSMFTAAQSALLAAEWSSHPQVRTLQVRRSPLRVWGK
jgi:hypothetical protein